MDINRCKNKKCQRELPSEYNHKYCEYCRNKYAEMTKKGLKTASGVIGSFAFMMVTKGKFNNKD